MSLVKVAGTDFPESVKYEARRLAAFRCCYCREMGDHVHHLTPKEDGGQGDIDNAIFLCVQCHDRHGHRPDKRAQLRQARGVWYEYVAEKYSTTDLDRFENLATKADVAQLAGEIKNLSAFIVENIQSGAMNRETAANIASTMVSSIVVAPHHGRLPAHLASSSGVFAPPLALRIKMTEHEGEST
jgi:hypothetical protein